MNHSSTKKERHYLANWLRKMGAEVLPVCDWEFARFIAGDELCIIHENRRKRLTAHGLAWEALQAWRDKDVIDLSNTPQEPDTPVEDWHAVGRAGCAVAERVKAGEAIDIDREAATIGIEPERLQRILAAHRCQPQATLAAAEGRADG